MFNKNPWHNVIAGVNSPQLVNAVIEIPKGSSGKYEVTFSFAL